MRRANERKRMTRRPLLLVGVAIALSALIAGSAAWAATSNSPRRTTRPHDAAPAGPTLSASQILSIAESAATAAGDANPTAIEQSAAPVTRTAATAATGADTVDDSAPSYLVAVRGSFVQRAVTPPLGPQVAAGRTGPTIDYPVLILMVSAATGQVTDFGLASNYPDMASVGQTTTTTPAPSQSMSSARRGAR